ncbi:CRTAC1 family protein [Actinomadura sp. 7K534]|uniref:CRTAC1 family protein n=1 Tax=Actinomadura sp. 7K534 TaxID=2530366 RepID=UPI00104EB99D|nr:CRTAC1 family protein [Actinomadura sp. 7K534]TDB97312.1 CRTAC1 family protein [Actinomadura sp. 7K534]
MIARASLRPLGVAAAFAVLTGACASGGSAPPPKVVNAGIAFQNIAVPGTPLAQYRRCPTLPEHQHRLANKKRLFISISDFTDEPLHDRGIPGVVVFDYNDDGYQDVYVTNGPCRPSSLFENMMGKTGKLEFRDVAEQAGAALPGFNANGACAGDIDNSGRDSLYVLGRNGPNRLLLNEGGGRFTDITEESGAGGGSYSHVSCTMGDFSGNGRLGIAIANSSNLKNAKAIMDDTSTYNQPNQLLANTGGSTPHFEDVSVSSGFATPTPLIGQTWAVAAVDLFQRGCTDLVVGSDQGAVPLAKFAGGRDRGFIRVYKNDCRGRFTDVTQQLGLMESPGAWMGFAFGNLNFNGELSMFVTNFGDFMLPMYGLPQNLGDFSSRWLIQRPDGTIADPRSPAQLHPSETGADPTLGGLNATPFGWGVSTLDYDNDGYTDVAYYGGMQAIVGVNADNPGTLLRNDGPKRLIKGLYPSFSYDPALTKSGADNRTRIITGVASGDLDNDGHVDLVTAAQGVMVGKLTSDPQDFGSPFDGSAYLAEYRAVGVLSYKPAPGKTGEGTLAVEMNKGGNGNGSVAVRTLGAKGLVEDARANRDGIGAVVSFTPAGLPAAISPVMAGSSFASQNSLVQSFGMGAAKTGTVEVLWPGGVRNKLYDVRPGERITFPEIPCDHTDRALSAKSFESCVDGALQDLADGGKVTEPMAARFASSALRAFHEAHQPN